MRTKQRQGAAYAAALAAAALITFLLIFEILTPATVVHASSNTNSVVANVVVSSICYIASNMIPASFGTVSPGTSHVTSFQLVVNDMSGNAASNVFVNVPIGVTGNWLLQTANLNFYSANTLWNPISLATYSGNALTNGNNGADTYVTMAAPSPTNPTNTVSVYFGVAIPAGQGAGVYQQNVILCCNTIAGATYC